MDDTPCGGPTWPAQAEEEGIMRRVFGIVATCALLLSQAESASAQIRYHTYTSGGTVGAYYTSGGQVYTLPGTVPAPTTGTGTFYGFPGNHYQPTYPSYGGYSPYGGATPPGTGYMVPSITFQTPTGPRTMSQGYTGTNSGDLYYQFGYPGYAAPSPFYSYGQTTYTPTSPGYVGYGQPSGASSFATGGNGTFVAPIPPVSAGVPGTLGGGIGTP
jgi:hypothetical protein